MRGCQPQHCPTVRYCPQIWNYTCYLRRTGNQTRKARRGETAPETRNGGTYSLRAPVGPHWAMIPPHPFHLATAVLPQRSRNDLLGGGGGGD